MGTIADLVNQRTSELSSILADINNEIETKGGTAASDFSSIANIISSLPSGGSQLIHGFAYGEFTTNGETSITISVGFEPKRCFLIQKNGDCHPASSSWVFRGVNFQDGSNSYTRETFWGYRWGNNYSQYNGMSNNLDKNTIQFSGNNIIFGLNSAQTELPVGVTYMYIAMDENVISGGTQIVNANTATIILYANAWDTSDGITQTVTVQGMGVSSAVWPSPSTEEDSELWADSKIYCDTQSTNSLTFSCNGTQPSENISVDIVWGESAVNIHSLSVTENGTYNAEAGEAFDFVSVNVPPTLPALTNPASASDILNGKEAYSDQGEKITGAFNDMFRYKTYGIYYEFASNKNMPHDIVLNLDSAGVRSANFSTTFAFQQAYEPGHSGTAQNSVSMNVEINFPSTAIGGPITFENLFNQGYGIKNAKVTGDLSTVINYNGIINNDLYLETLDMEFDFTSVPETAVEQKICYQTLNNTVLAEIRFKPNTLKANCNLKSLPSLSNSSLVSIANGLRADASGKTLTFHATPFALCDTIMGTIDNGTFIADSVGQTTLKSFITTTKGWSLASG